MRKTLGIASLALITLSLTLTSCAINSEELSPQYEKFNQQLGTNPQQVLNDLQLIEVGLSDSKLKSEHHYTLSLAYLTLAYPQKSLDQANLALKHLPVKQSKWLYHNIMIVKSQAMELSGNAKAALPLIEQSVQWAKQNNDQELLVDALVGLGYIENTMRHSTKALNAFMQAYELAPEHDAIVTKSAIASSIALVYEYRREDELAVPYFEESVAYHRSHDNFLELSISLYGLGRANKNMGKSELAFNQLRESLDLSRAIGDDQGVAYALKELAPLYIEQDQIQVAESMLLEAAQLFEDSENKLMLFDVHKTLAVFFMNLDNLEGAQARLNHAKHFLDADSMPGQNISLSEIEAKLLSKQGSHQIAYEKLASTVAKKQALQTAASTQQLHELRTQFELENKAKENLQLSEENQRQKINLLKQDQKNQLLIIGISTTAIIILLLSLLIYRSRSQKKQLFKLANFDGLTALANRSHSTQLLNQAQKQLKKDQTMYVAMLDLDNFKQINDHFGHDVGDEVLKKFGAICIETFADTDIYGRYGGEEFIVGMMTNNQDQAIKTLDQLRQSFKSVTDELKLQPVITGFSAGLSTCQSTDNLKEKIQAADVAMYDAKKCGRNQTIISQPQQSID